MTHILMMVAYAASAVTLAALGVALVRGGRFTPALVATMPELRALVVVSNADGSCSYGPAFGVHLIVSYMLLGGAALHMYGARARIPVLARHRPAAMLIAWAVPMFVNLLRTFLG